MPVTYLEERLAEQAAWHTQKATWNKRRYYFVEITTLTTGALIPLINAFDLEPTLQRSLSAIFGTIVACAVGINKLCKFQEKWLSYRGVAENLRREKELFTYAAGEYAAADTGARERLLVERTEGLLASVTTQFIALHKPDGQKQG